MAQVRCAEAGSEVGDAGDTEHVDAHVARDDGFGNGGHADEGCAEGAEGANLRGGFEAWSGRGEVDAFVEREALLGGGLLCECAQWLAVGLGHVEEA